MASERRILLFRDDESSHASRSGRIVEEVLPTKGTPSPSFYYQTTLDALENDGDIMVTLDVLAKQVGILGIFSDWSATVTYYANCMGLK